MKTTFIGIDVSSETLDIAVKQEKVNSYKINNDSKSIQRFFQQFNDAQTVVAMENTGRYNWPLHRVFEKMSIRVYELNPFDLSKSQGLVRGKTDKTDAQLICSYIERNYMCLKPWKPVPEELKELKVLLAERETRIKSKRKALSQIHSLKEMKGTKLGKKLIGFHQEEISFINAQIKLIETEIEELIRSNPELKEQARLVRTVPGVGKVLSWVILVKTVGFTSITNPRKLACYAGVVPFEHQSGTSIKSKPRVSVYADKAVKTLLHLAAMSAIRLNNDLRAYYLRKITEGKNKMSVLNAVRNKIIHRVYAVIRNQKEYSFNLTVS